MAVKPVTPKTALAGERGFFSSVNSYALIAECLFLCYALLIVPGNWAFVAVGVTLLAFECFRTLLVYLWCGFVLTSAPREVHQGGLCPEPLLTYDPPISSADSSEEDDSSLDVWFGRNRRDITVRANDVLNTDNAKTVEKLDRCCENLWLYGQDARTGKTRKRATTHRDKSCTIKPRDVIGSHARCFVQEHDAVSFLALLEALERIRASLPAHNKQRRECENVWKRVVRGTKLEAPLLHVACEYNNYTAAAKLLRTGCDPNLRDAEGQTPLCVACRYGASATICKALLDAGADPDLQDREHLFAPLVWAVLRNRADVAKVLLGPGASASRPQGKQHSNVLHFAVISGCEQDLLKEIVFKQVSAAVKLSCTPENWEAAEKANAIQLFKAQNASHKSPLQMALVLKRRPALQLFAELCSRDVSVLKNAPLGKNGLLLELLCNEEIGTLVEQVFSLGSPKNAAHDTCVVAVNSGNAAPIHQATGCVSASCS